MKLQKKHLKMPTSWWATKFNASVQEIRIMTMTLPRKEVFRKKRKKKGRGSKKIEKK